MFPGFSSLCNGLVLFQFGFCWLRTENSRGQKREGPLKAHLRSCDCAPSSGTEILSLFAHFGHPPLTEFIQERIDEMLWYATVCTGMRWYALGCACYLPAMPQYAPVCTDVP